MADFRPFSDEKLDQWIASGGSPHDLQAAISEREHRQTNKAIQQSANSNQELIAEQQRLRSVVDSMASEQSQMKLAVLGIHRLDVWILIVGAVAAISGLLLLLLDFLHESGAGK